MSETEIHILSTDTHLLILTVDNTGELKVITKLNAADVVAIVEQVLEAARRRAGTGDDDAANFTEAFE